MNIFAHRGISGNFPENTMTAFNAAASNNVYGIELDVQMTKDRNIVIVHDENLLRTTGLDKMVKDICYDELVTLNANKTHTEITQEHIPTLEEYLKWVKDKNIVTNIEIKSSIVYYPGLEESVYKMVESFNLGNKVIYSSFNPLSLVKIKSLDKNNKCGLLTENQLINAGKCCNDFGFDYYHPPVEKLTRNIVDECHDNNIAVNVWTVESINTLDKLKTLGADGAFCNYLFN